MKKLLLTWSILFMGWTFVSAQVAFFDDFEGYPAVTTQNDTTLGPWKYTRNNNGRLQTAFQPYQGNRAITLDAYPSGTFSNNWWTLTVDLSAYDTTSDSVVLEFQVTDYGDETHTGDSIAVRGDSTLGWINVMQMTPGAWSNGTWQQFTIVLTDALRAAGQQFGTTFQVRFAQYDNFAVQSDGIAFDNVKIKKIGPDVAVSAVDSPTSGCGLTNNEPMWITIASYGLPISAGTAIPYAVQLDNGTPCTDTFIVGSGGLPAGSDTTINSNCAGNFSAAGDHTVKAWTSMAGDADSTNDTTVVTIANDPLISTFPYTESFESGPAGWRVESSNGTTTWALGELHATASPGTIDTAADGTFAWETDTSGNYVNNERGWVLSPCFDFSGLSNPVKLTLSVWWESENSWDGGAIDTGDALGSNWARLGAYGDPNNWYNDNTISGLFWTGNQHGWTGTGTNSSGGWVNASRVITEFAGRSDYIRFRVLFGSDGSVTSGDGFAFDYVRIDEIQNDVGVSAVASPMSGCGLGNNDSVWLTIHNYGAGLTAGTPIPYAVQVNNGTTCTDTLIVGSSGFTTGEDTTFNSNCTGNFSALGNHTIKAWTDLVNDIDYSNDTTTQTVENKQPPTLGPADIFIDDFECLPSLLTQVSGTVLMSGAPSAQWEYTNTSNGRLQTTYTNHTSGGMQAVTLDANPVSNSNNWMTVTLDMSSYDTATNPIELVFWWTDHGDETFGGGDSIAIRGSNTDPWINVLNLDPTNNTDGIWNEEKINITNALQAAGQNFSSTFQIRFSQYDNYYVPIDGISYDDIRVHELQSDVGVSAVDSPVSGCGLGSEPIWITIYNYGVTLASGTAVPYAVRVDNGTPCLDTFIVGSGGMATGDDTTINSNCTGDFTSAGLHSVEAWTDLANDVDSSNDTITAGILTIPTISTFPYVEDFESSDGGWYNFTVLGGTSPWEWGDPSAYTYTNNNINSAGQGSKAWEVDLDGPYDNNQIVALVSPCFDFSGQGKVSLAFLANWNSESGWDGTRFDTLVHTGTGVNNLVGTQNATNWYTHTNITAFGTAGWSGSSNGWVTATKVFPYELANDLVQFAFIFGSDGSVNSYDGFGMDSFAISVVSYCYIDSAVVTICQGDSALIHGAYQTQPGRYIDTFTVNNCDSISIIDLVVNPTYDTTLTTTICQGDTVWVGNTPYTQSGNYSDTFNTVNGCDSVVNLNLTVLPSPASYDTTYICQGDSAMVFGSYQTQAGTYVDTNTAANGCDSFSYLTLVVYPTYNIQQTMAICQGDSALIFGQWQSSAGVYDSTFATVHGCDSAVSITLVVNPTYAIYDTAHICQGDSVQVFGNWVDTAGTFDSLFTTAAGCDSMVTVTVMLHPNYTVLDTVTICQGDSALIHGTWQSQPGVYPYTYSSMFGCDSSVYTTLIVNPTYATTVNDTICDGDTAWIGNTPYTQAGTYTGTLSTAAGCDSVVTLNLAVTTIDTGVTVSGDTLVANQVGAAYQWLDCDSNMAPITGATAQTFVPMTSGIYAVTITYNGCVATSGCHVVVMAGLADVEATFGLRVYPNPAREVLYFEPSRPGTYELRLYDLLGKEQFRRRAAMRGRYALNLAGLSKGVYFLEVRNGDKVEVLRLVIE